MQFALSLATSVALLFATRATLLDETIEPVDDAGVPVAEQALSEVGANPSDWYRPINYRQCEAIFKAVSATGSAKMYGQRISRWRILMGHELSVDLEDVELFTEVAELFCEGPHEPGLLDALAGLRFVLADSNLIYQVEESLLGSVTGYAFELEESPALLARVKLLGRMPWIAGVTIRMRDPDHPSPELVAALRSLRVLYPVSLCDLNGVNLQVERMWKAFAAGADSFEAGPLD